MDCKKNETKTVSLDLSGHPELLEELIAVASKKNSTNHTHELKQCINKAKKQAKDGKFGTNKTEVEKKLKEHIKDCHEKHIDEKKHHSATEKCVNEVKKDAHAGKFGAEKTQVVKQVSEGVKTCHEKHDKEE
jgi:hypothetical protein